MTEAYKRVTDQQVALFRHCFTGLPSVYGTYDPITGRAWQVKAPVTDQVIRNHLMGLCPFGVYLLVHDRTRAIVVDFDTLDPEPPQRFVLNAARRGLPAYIERSKSKGHHVWLFADAGGILAANGRRTAIAILEEMGLERVEVFPKQDCLHHGSFGNFINTPLFRRLTATGHSVFVDPENALLPFPDQWAFLANIQRIREDQLDTGMPICAATTAAVPQQQVFQERLGAEPPINPRAYALPPCARKMLLRGVSDGQRVICFRLGIHLKRFGIPRDLAVIMLQAWARKNHPVGKRILTDSEIVSQVTYAYRKPYWGYGCRDPFVRKYCQSACPVLWQTEAISAPVPRNAQTSKPARKDLMSQEDNAAKSMAFLFPDAPPAAQPVAPPPAPASPPTMAERCTGLLFCHVCGAAAAAEQAGEFCPRCRSRRCVSCGDL